MLAVVFKISLTQDWRENKKFTYFIFNLENNKIEILVLTF